MSLTAVVTENRRRSAPYTATSPLMCCAQPLFHVITFVFAMSPSSRPRAPLRPHVSLTPGHPRRGCRAQAARRLQSHWHAGRGHSGQGLLWGKRGVLRSWHTKPTFQEPCLDQKVVLELTAKVRASKLAVRWFCNSSTSNRGYVWSWKIWRTS